MFLYKMLSIRYTYVLPFKSFVRQNEKMMIEGKYGLKLITKKTDVM